LSVVRLLHSLVDIIGDLVCEVWACEQVPSNLLFCSSHVRFFGLYPRGREISRMQLNMIPGKSMSLPPTLRIDISGRRSEVAHLEYGKNDVS